MWQLFPGSNMPMWGKKKSEIPGSSLVSQGKYILHGALHWELQRQASTLTKIPGQNPKPNQMNPDKHPTIPPIYVYLQ